MKAITYNYYIFDQVKIRRKSNISNVGWFVKNYLLLLLICVYELYITRHDMIWCYVCDTLYSVHLLNQRAVCSAVPSYRLARVIFTVVVQRRTTSNRKYLLQPLDKTETKPALESLLFFPTPKSCTKLPSHIH